MASAAADPRYGWSAVRQSLTHFERSKVVQAIGVRNAVGVFLPLMAGLLTGNIRPGLVAATGALNVSYADGTDGYGVRGRRMFVSSAVCGLAVLVGSATGWNSVTSVAVASAWAFVAGLLIALGGPPSDLGNISLVTLLVFAARPLKPADAVMAGGLAFGGGLLQMALALLLWPVHRFEPERRALSELYKHLAEFAQAEISEAPFSPLQAPPGSVHSTQAQQALTYLATQHDLEAERYVSILSQGERIRLGMLTLTRLRTRLSREAETGEIHAILNRVFAIVAPLLLTFARSLSTGRPSELDSGWVAALEGLMQELRQHEQAPRFAPVRALIMDSFLQSEALSGQLRAVRDLILNTTVTGEINFRRREERKPWRLQLGGSVARLRANLSFRSSACRHALRLTVCIAIGDTLARSISWYRWYWIPMTIAIVLRPDFKSTFSRGTLRLAGTFAGLVLATVLFHVLHPAPALQIVLIAVLMYVLRSYGAANYGVFVVALSALVVLLVALTGVSPREVIEARGLNTAIGGAIALAAYWLWPTREQTQIADTLAQMLDDYRDYFRAVREAYLPGSPPDPGELDRKRLAARLARSNAEASLDRMAAEPHIRPESMLVLHAMLASSHRLIHALMAIESGVPAGVPLPPRETFLTFANHVEFTLHALAAALRGSPVEPGDMPRLRQDWDLLVRSEGAAVARNALINTEADRIANSLNTLCEQVFRWKQRLTTGAA